VGGWLGGGGGGGEGGRLKTPRTTSGKGRTLAVAPVQRLIAMGGENSNKKLIGRGKAGEVDRTISYHRKNAESKGLEQRKMSKKKSLLLRGDLTRRKKGVKRLSVISS